MRTGKLPVSFIILVATIVFFLAPSDMVLAQEESGYAILWRDLDERLDKGLAELSSIKEDKERQAKNSLVAKDFIGAVGSGYARLLEEWTGQKINQDMVNFFVGGVQAFFMYYLNQSTPILTRLAYEDLKGFLKNRAFIYECLNMAKDPKLLSARISQFNRQGDPKYPSFTISGGAATILPSTNDLKISRISLERDRGYQGNGNRAIDSGEVLSLGISLKNHGSKDWRSTSAFLMSMDPLVQVDVSEVIYSVRDESTGETRTFVPGMEIDSPTSYTISISPECPDQAELKLKLRVWDSDFGGENDEFAEYFTIKVNRVGPLVFGDIKIDDDIPGYSNGNGNGIIEPKETIEYRMAVRNDGVVPVDNVQATMSTDAEFVSFSSSPSGSSLRFKRVEPRADRPLSSSFIFSIGDESKVNEKDFFLLLKTDAVARGASYSWLDGYVEKVAKSVKAKVVSIPAGADIQIDGVPAGKAPLETAPLPAGSEMLVTAVHSGITASLKTIVPLDSKPVEIRVEKEIEIRSEPAGATLLLDGKVLGPSPQRIKLEAGSEHSIRADFGEWDARAKFKVDSALDSLRLVPMTGALSITAQPHLALISVPGIQLAMSADASYAAEDVPPGRYYLEASLPDYETQRVDFEVKPGEKASLAISLQKAQRSLTIQSSPPGAIITVDGVEIGAAPVETIPHEVGSAHTIFADFNKEMSGKRQVTVSLDSTPIVIEPDTGSLRIDVTPPDARVSIDGIELERVGEGKYKASNIKPGTYNVRAGKDRFFPIEKPIVVASGKSLSETIVLREIPSIVEMISVSGGTFMMGSNSGDSDEKPVHQVMVSSFMIGKYEVTQEQYQKVMGTNPSNFKSDLEAPRRPVEQVSWYDAVAFCNKLSELEGLQKVYTITGTNVQADFSRNGYRLPTEAEWEYAARGGSQSKGYTYSGSNSIDSVAWYSSNSGNTTHAVGMKAPNELGLYDMSGNVWEWCWDWYKNSYDYGAQKDPLGASSGDSRVDRGGGWYFSPSNLRSAIRYNTSPGGGNNNLGFRLLRRP